MGRSVSFAARPEFNMTLEEAFPKVEANFVPFGSRVLLQIRSAKDMTKGGIALPTESRDTELWNTQVAKVVAVGPVAFRNRQTLEFWKEGPWAAVGSYVRGPKFGGDKFEVHIPGREKDEVALFHIVNDLDLMGAVEDPLAVVAFV